MRTARCIVLDGMGVIFGAVDADADAAATLRIAAEQFDVTMGFRHMADAALQPTDGI